MASTQTMLRSTNNRALVRVIGGAAADAETITLASLVASHQEVEEGGTPAVNIAKMIVSSNNGVTITRGATVVATVYGSINLDESDWVLNDANTEDLIVEFTGGPGMVLLELSKVSGYVLQIQPDQGGIYDDPDSVAN